jgi:predicted LPLAT superfamily acyltransferase
MADPIQLRDDGGQWLRFPERGSTAAISALVWASRLIGRRGIRIVLYGVALYYALFARRAARASRQYLSLMYERVTFSMVYRHVLQFVQCALDRIFFVQERFGPFESTHHGQEHLFALKSSGRGAILLGAHVGSFEVMRALAKARDLKINALVHFENARRINTVLRRLNPDFMESIIEIDSANPAFIFEVQQRVEAGEMVAILGDRVGLGEKSVEVEFLGQPARFPTGPFVLAAALGCPVYLTFGLHHPPNGYALYCVPFAERLELPRESRQQAVTDEVQRWADRLEYFCRMAPYNWFNFYDFWKR